MTLNDMYAILESKPFYEESKSNKFTFVDNFIRIDRKALIPFSIYKEDENFFLAPDVAFTSEKELRIEIDTSEGELIHFYGKTSGKKLLTLNEYR
jgi:hypothetical protein